MSVDVFLCSCAQDDIRAGLADATYARWLGMGARIIKIGPHDIGCGGMEFQGLRRNWIEAHAQSDIYIMAEDDCMPIGPDFIERGIAILDRHPEFAVLSPLLLPYPEPPSMWQDDECYQGITSGGINFTRRGIMIDMKVPPNTLFDESSQAGWLVGRGYKVGWMKKLKQNHLGAGISTIWPDSYTGKTQIFDI